MIEYSAPNTNKPLHLGHLRNDSIGMALSNLLSFNNYKVIKANLYSNRGIHICKSMLAYKKYGKNKKPNKKSDHFVGDFYVMFMQKVKENPSLDQEAQDLLKKWENKDKETLALWKKMDNWAIQGFKQTYKTFGSKFDVEFKESDYYDKAKPIIELGIKNKVFHKDQDNSIVIDLTNYDLSKKVIMRADSTSIYITNDLALTKHKFEKYKLDKAIWIVASEQNLYFKQLFKTLELLNFKFANKCYHLNYGMVFLPEGKMKSREGKVVDADTLIENMIKLAKQEILKRNKKLSKDKLESRARQIALAAIKFYLLKTEPFKDILFNPEKSISFEGETGPYIQYAYARINSILKKVKQIKKPDYNLLTSNEEIKIINLLKDFPNLVEDAAKTYKISLIATYSLELAQAFSEFYEKIPVLKTEENIKIARLNLLLAVKQVLKNSLTLLNIEVPDQM